jgi:hypothetical protein
MAKAPSLPTSTPRCIAQGVGLKLHCQLTAILGAFRSYMTVAVFSQDSRFEEPRDIPLHRGPDGHNPIRSLRARALLVDMEEGVVNQVG